jgi:hypothetical protein
MLMCGCGGGGFVRACARNPRALCAIRTASLVLVLITLLTLLISLFPTLLTQAPINAYVWVWGGCVRSRAIRTLSARACALSALAMRHQDSQSLPSHHYCFDLVIFSFPHFSTRARIARARTPRTHTLTPT